MLAVGTIAGVALDVTEFEPLLADDLLLRVLNLLVVLYIGSATVRICSRMADMVADNLFVVLAGRSMFYPAG